MSDTYFRVNAPGVIYEQFEDELVAINLDTGAYHSLVGVAADVFLLLTEGATVGELVGALAGKYAATPEQIAAAMPDFMEQLRRENLIAETAAPMRTVPLTLGDAATGVPFVAPGLAAYHDLDSLFLLDPIHDVGEQGWPQPRPDAASSRAKDAA